MAHELTYPATTEHACFLEAAWQVGARLCREAIWSGDRCNWLGDAMEFTSNAWSVAHRSFGPDLYSGTSGIALFLGHLYRLTGERLFRRTAEGALRQAWSRRETMTGPARISFYSGWLGVAWVRSELAPVLETDNLADEANALAAGLMDCEVSPQLLDIISGSAGAIPASLELHRRQPHDFLLELVRCHAENLLQSAHRSDAGCSWSSPNIPAKANLTGFSHGAAGMAWGLLEAHRVLKTETYRQTAAEALRYERQWFNTEQQNWIDLRAPDAAAPAPTSVPVCSTAWCHGAPGIALSRLRAYELLQDDQYRLEAEAALHSTAKSLSAASQPGYGNFSLCHGHCGNAEALLYASQVLGSKHRHIADQTAHHAIELHSKSQSPWPCGVPNGGETPGLMLGLAGIGYFLLRLCQPKHVPSVVILLPPRGPKAATKPHSARPKASRPL